MSSDEIVTLQFGHYCNHIGAHWWNIQEANFIYNGNVEPEINTDVLFREGENLNKVQTFTPRLLLVDLKDSLQNLSVCGKLYDNINTKPNVLWDADKLEVLEEPSLDKNEFLNDIEKIDSYMESDDINCDVNEIRNKEYNLDSSIRVWSDYLSTVYHPRTLNIINKYRHNDEKGKFSTFNQGVEISKTEFFTDDWADRCRLYVEECDYLQGFQVLFDCYDGNSGLAYAALEHIRDEYSSAAVIAFPTWSTNGCNTCSDNNAVRTLNTALSINCLIEFASTFVPLSTTLEGWKIPGKATMFHHLKYDDQLSYHTSAILASFLDSVTLNYRSRKNRTRLSQFCSRLTPVGRTCLAGSFFLPYSNDSTSSLLNVLENQPDHPYWCSVTPFYQTENDAGCAQNMLARGLSMYELFSARDLKKENPSNPVYNCKTANELFSLFLEFSSPFGLSLSNSKVDYFNMPMKTSSSFPSIFSDDAQTTYRPHKCPIVTRLCNSDHCKTTLLNLYEDSRKINLNLHEEFFVGQLERLDFTEAFENIITLSENY